MNRYCNWNCCNYLCWFCFLFSAEELGALKTTLNDWQHHQQLETLTLEAGNNNPLYCRQPEADSRRQTTGCRQPEADNHAQRANRHGPHTSFETSQPQPSHSPNAATWHPRHSSNKQTASRTEYMSCLLAIFSDQICRLFMLWHSAMSVPHENIVRGVEHKVLELKKEIFSIHKP